MIIKIEQKEIEWIKERKEEREKRSESEREWHKQIEKKEKLERGTDGGDRQRE